MTATTELLTIGDLAKELGISQRTIRYYEERSLLHPQRTNGGQRIYTRRERGRLKLILRAKRAGFDLQEVKEVLDLYDILPSDQVEQAQATKLIDMTQRRLANLNQTIDELTDLRDALLTHLDKLKKLDTHATPHNKA